MRDALDVAYAFRHTIVLGIVAAAALWWLG